MKFFGSYHVSRSPRRKRETARTKEKRCAHFLSSSLRVIERLNIRLLCLFLLSMMYPIAAAAVVVFHAILVSVQGRARERSGELALVHTSDLSRRECAGRESDEYAVRSRVTVQCACHADRQRQWPVGCLLWSDVGSNHQCP